MQENSCYSLFGVERNMSIYSDLVKIDIYFEPNNREMTSNRSRCAKRAKLLDLIKPR